jgi:hypothetical protein
MATTTATSLLAADVAKDAQAARDSFRAAREISDRCATAGRRMQALRQRYRKDDGTFAIVEARAATQQVAEVLTLAAGAPTRAALGRELEEAAAQLAALIREVAP